MHTSNISCVKKKINLHTQANVIHQGQALVYKGEMVGESDLEMNAD